MPGNADYSKQLDDRSEGIATDHNMIDDHVFVESVEKQIREAEAEANRREFISDDEVERLRAILKG